LNRRPGLCKYVSDDQDSGYEIIYRYNRVGATTFAARVFDDAYREMPGNDYNMEKNLPQHDWAALFQTLQARAGAAFRKQDGH